MPIFVLPRESDAKEAEIREVQAFFMIESHIGCGTIFLVQSKVY
jgi:hypothetical protein